MDAQAEPSDNRGGRKEEKLLTSQGEAAASLELQGWQPFSRLDRNIQKGPCVYPAFLSFRGSRQREEQLAQVAWEPWREREAEAPAFSTTCYSLPSFVI